MQLLYTKIVLLISISYSLTAMELPEKLVYNLPKSSSVRKKYMPDLFGKGFKAPRNNIALKEKGNLNLLVPEQIDSTLPPLLHKKSLDGAEKHMKKELENAKLKNENLKLCAKLIYILKIKLSFSPRSTRIRS